VAVIYVVKDITSEAGRTVKVYRARIGESHVSAVLARRTATDDYAFGVAAVRDGGLVADWSDVYEFEEDALKDLSIWSETFSGVEETVPALVAVAERMSR